jgi:superfamily I DNA/RNA helicase
VRAKVPFVNLAGGSFWASKHVADIIAYLKLTQDRGDKDAFKRVYNIASVWMEQPFDMKDRATGKVVRAKGEYSPTRWLSKAFMRECWDSYEYAGKALGSRQGWRWRAGVDDLGRLLDTAVKDQYGEPATPDAMVMSLIDLCYRDYLAATEGITGGDESENGKMEDLYTVAEVAGEYEDLDGFLASVDEMVKAAEAAKEKSLDEFLVISTIHRLKGMERPVVYGVGMSERLLPHRFSMEPPPQFGVLPTGGMGRVEDERDVCFVLCSRAKEQVHLSGVKYYRNDILRPSRFVRELGLDIIQEEEVEERIPWGSAKSRWDEAVERVENAGEV